MTYRESPDEKSNKKKLRTSKKGGLGNGKLLKRLIDELNFINIIIKFYATVESFEPNKNYKKSINKLGNLIIRIYGILWRKFFYIFETVKYLTIILKNLS